MARLILGYPDIPYLWTSTEAPANAAGSPAMLCATFKDSSGMCDKNVTSVSDVSKIRHVNYKIYKILQVISSNYLGCIPRISSFSKE